MKCVSYFFYASLLFFIHGAYSNDFFHLEHLPQGTKIPILKFINLIPAAKTTPLKDAQLEDVYIQAVAETPAVNAHIEMFGKMKLKTSLPGLQNIGDLDLSVIGKLFSAFGRGAAPISSPLPSPEALAAKKAAEDFKAGEKIFGISHTEEAEFMSEEPIPFGYGEIETKAEPSKPTPSTPTELELIPERKTYLTRYDEAIKSLNSLSPNLATSEEVQNLVKELATEKGRLADPEITLNALKHATRYLERENVISPPKLNQILPEQFAQEDITAVQNRFTNALKELDRRIAVASPGTQKALTIERDALKYAQDDFQRRSSGPRDTQGKVKISKQMQLQFLPTLAGEEFNLEYTLVSKPGQTMVPQAPIAKPGQAVGPQVQRTLTQQYEDTIVALKKLPQSGVIPSLVRQLENEKTMIPKLSPAPSTTPPTLKTAQQIVQRESGTMQPLQPQTPVQPTLTQQYEDTIAALKKLPQSGVIPSLLKQLENEKTMIPKLSSAPSTTPPTLKTAQQIVQRESGLTQPLQPQIPLAKPITPEQAFAREVGKNEVLYREEDPIWKFRIASLPTPAGTAGAGKYVVIEGPAGKEYLFDSAQVIGAGFTKEQLEQYVAGRETQIAFQQQPIKYDAANVLKKQMGEVLSKLQLLPRTEYSTNLINTLNYELSQLNRLGTLPSVGEINEYSGLKKAQEYLTRVGTPPPPQPPLKEKVAATTERAKQQLKEQLSAAAISAKEKITALPAQIQEEFKAARDALNKLFIQKRSEITRVGAALFLITLQNPNYRPFQNIQIPDLPPVDVPGIKDIELNNAELGVFFAPPQVFSIWAQGTGRVINIPLLAKVLFNYEKMQDPTTGRMVDNTGVVLQAGLPEEWKFSDSFPEMKSFDRLVIKRAYVYVSTINYVDYTIPTKIMPSSSISIANVPGRPTVGMLPGITIRPGLSLYGEINLRKLIPEIFEHLNFAGLETASAYGTISYKPENCQIGIGLPDLIKIENSPFKLGGVWAEIHAKNTLSGPVPEVSVVIALVIQPSPKDETLTFTARASSDVTGGMVAFSMQGFWNNALGVDGLSIGDLAIQLHTDYKALFAGVPITGGGFTGTFKFGTQEDSTIIKFASLFAATSTGQEVAIQAKLDGTLSVWQIIDGCKALAINKAKQDKKSTKSIEENYNKILNSAVAKQFGNVAIRNTDFKVASSTVRIGEFFILQGFTAKGELTLLGVTAGLDFNFGQSGVTGTGYLSPIKIGDVFSLTGAGMDKQYGTPDDAALISLALNFMKQHLIITGQVKLLGIEQQTDIFIDTEGLNCTITGKLFNLFDASVLLKSRGDITNPDLYFKASMKQEFTKYIVDETIKALRASTQDSVNKLKDAQNEVDKINTNIADLDKQIAERKKRLDELTKVAAQAPKTSPEITKLGLELTGLETARIATIGARNDAQKILAGSQDAINKFNAAQQEVNKLNANVADFDNQISSRKRRIDELGKNFLEGVKNAPEITKLGLEVAGLETAKAGTVASRNTATGVLNSLSSTASLISTNQGQIDNLNKEIARLDTQIADHKKQIDTLSKQFTQGIQTSGSPEITKLGLELTGLETAKAGAIASRETAKGALEGVKRWIGGASTIAEAFVVHAAVPLDIRESTLEASVQDIAKGKLPRFTANVAILGKKLNLDMQLDFSSPDKARQSAQAIAQQILALFK